MDSDEHSGTERQLEAPWLFRGTDLNRVLALSDGIFAFAMTLLVLELGVGLPGDASASVLRQYLTGQAFLTSLFGYLISFFVISLWWQGHHLVFSYIRRYNRSLIRLNSVFLIFIAVVPFATTVLNDSSSGAVGDIVFASIQIGAGVTLGLLWWFASGPWALVAPRFPADWRSYITVHTFSTPLIFAISIPIALIDPGVGEATWLGVFVVTLAARRKVRDFSVGPSGKAP